MDMVGQLVPSTNEQDRDGASITTEWIQDACKKKQQNIWLYTGTQRRGHSPPEPPPNRNDDDSPPKDGILSRVEGAESRMNSNSKNKDPTLVGPSREQRSSPAGRTNSTKKTTNDSHLYPTTSHGSRNGRICQKLSGRV